MAPRLRTRRNSYSLSIGVPPVCPVGVTVTDGPFLAVAHSLHPILPDVCLGRQHSRNRMNILGVVIRLKLQNQPHVIADSEFMRSHRHTLPTKRPRACGLADHAGLKLLVTAGNPDPYTAEGGG